MQARRRPKLLHEYLTDELRQQILQLPAGAVVPAETEIVRQHDASLLTVREALRSLAQEGLIQRRQGKGTFVLDRRARQHVAILMEPDFGHPASAFFFRNVTQQLRRFFDAHHVSNRLYLGTQPPDELATEPTCREFVESIEHGQLCGVVAVVTVPHPRWREQARQQQIPVVAPAGSDHTVAIDEAAIVRQAVEWLVQQGRRRIALMYAGSAEPTAFREAMAAAGLPVEPAWVRGELNPVKHGAGWEGFRELWSARTDKPDGLVVTDDILMQDAALAVIETGVRVPQQLMIASHGNKGSEMRFPFPVHWLLIDPVEYAQAMGGMLLKLLRGEPVPVPHVKIASHPPSSLDPAPIGVEPVRRG
jgi:DNA-binding LacI/PurR family transcriptional regulator